MNPLLIVVDDDPDDIEFFSIALKEVNPDCDFKYFLNGIDFLNFFSTVRNVSQPTAVAIDINMPMLSGVELLKLLFKNHSVDYTPFFVITTASADKHEKQCKSLGARGYYTKPVCGEEWRQIVELIIKTAR
jgi:CheY-like chemotaxis protein